MLTYQVIPVHTLSWMYYWLYYEQQMETVILSFSSGFCPFICSMFLIFLPFSRAILSVNTFFFYLLRISDSFVLFVEAGMVHLVWLSGWAFRRLQFHFLSPGSWHPVTDTVKNSCLTNQCISLKSTESCHWK